LYDQHQLLLQILLIGFLYQFGLDESLQAQGSKEIKGILTPGSIVDSFISKDTDVSIEIPRAIGVASKVDAELLKREKGNKEFSEGNFSSAIRTYTECLGMKVSYFYHIIITRMNFHSQASNYIAFSNRAMAYIKNKDYINAEVCFLIFLLFHLDSYIFRIEYSTLCWDVSARVVEGLQLCHKDKPRSCKILPSTSDRKKCVRKTSCGARGSRAGA